MNSAARMVVLVVLAALTVGAALWVVIFPRRASPGRPVPMASEPGSMPGPIRHDPSRLRPTLAIIASSSCRSGIRQPVTAQPQRYMDSSEPIRVLAKRLHVPAFLLRNVGARADARTRETHLPQQGAFQFSSTLQGLLVFRDASLFWIEELASHGYVVVGLDQPGTAAATALSRGRSSASSTSRFRSVHAVGVVAWIRPRPDSEWRRASGRHNSVPGG